MQAMGMQNWRSLCSESKEGVALTIAHVHTQVFFCSHLLGFRTPKDEDKAEALFEATFKAQELSEVVRARAASHLARIFNDRVDTKEVDLKDAMPVLGYSVGAVGLGLISPNVLWIAGCWNGVRNQFGGTSGVLHLLWEAYDARQQEMEDDRSSRSHKVQRAPNKYRCANPGCTIESLRRGPLKKCSGKCDVDVKPYYCDKSCQLAVSTYLCTGSK